jgi:tetraacyldisaccharide-1-P 4'-kinase
MSHSRSITIQVIKIAVQRVTVELDGDYLLRCGIGNPERFLQTFKHPLAVLMWELTEASISLDRC